MEQHLEVATFLANFLDSRFGIGKFRFGASAIIDLIPGIGDALDAALSFYIVWIAVQMRIPPVKIVEMVINIVVSFFIGLIPIAGDAAYIFYKPNLRNLAILKSAVRRSSVKGEIIQ